MTITSSADADGGNSEPEPARRKRTDAIVDAIKRMIVEHGLGPGDRLPQEKELTVLYAASRGTVREALKALEVQGLIRIRTGPGGGAFIERMSESRAMSLLSNFLFAKNLSISHIYAINQHATAAHVIKTGNKIYQCRFARACAANNCQDFSR